MHPDEQISVHITYSVRFTDLPQDIKDVVSDVADEWEINGGQQLGFDSLLDYLTDHDKKMQYDDVIKFMNKNDLEDTYYIDLDW